MAYDRKKIPNYEPTRRRLWADQEGVCWLCFSLIDIKTPAKTPGAGEIDHIEPLSRGGAHHIHNWCLLHRSCNQFKADKPLPIAQREWKALQLYPSIWQ